MVAGDIVADGRGWGRGWGPGSWRPISRRRVLSRRILPRHYAGFGPRYYGGFYGYPGFWGGLGLGLGIGNAFGPGYYGGGVAYPAYYAGTGYGGRNCYPALWHHELQSGDDDSRRHLSRGVLRQFEYHHDAGDNRGVVREQRPISVLAE
ncbi:MAG: hypothetical protein U0872_03260 [Planctomycetaceae bacterium]